MPECIRPLALIALCVERRQSDAQTSTCVLYNDQEPNMLRPHAGPPHLVGPASKELSLRHEFGLRFGIN